MTNAMSEIILMLIPLHVSSYTIIGMQDGIKVPHDKPGDSSIKRAFMAKVIPEKSSFSRCIMIIDEGDFERLNEGWGSDLTRKPLGRGVFISEVEFVRIPTY